MCVCVCACVGVCMCVGGVCMCVLVHYLYVHGRVAGQKGRVPHVKNKCASLTVFVSVQVCVRVFKCICYI